MSNFTNSSDLERGEILTLLWFLKNHKDLHHFSFEIVRTSNLICKKEGQKTVIGIPSDLFFHPKNYFEECFRKIGMHLKQIHDVSSIDQRRALALEKRINDQLGSAVDGPQKEPATRFLIRIDDYPSPRAQSQDFVQFHKIAVQFKIPYLLAVTPFYEGRKLTQDEVELLQRCNAEGAAIGVHGFTHQKRNPPYANELLGMPQKELAEKITAAKHYFQEHHIETQIFIPPFNAYDASTLRLLAQHFPVLCGGPESVTSVGYRIFSFIGESLYVPSYRGVYDVRPRDFNFIENLKHQKGHSIIPITLHWANEVKNRFSKVKDLCALLSGSVMPWTELLETRSKLLNFLNN